MEASPYLRMGAEHFPKQLHLPGSAPKVTPSPKAAPSLELFLFSLARFSVPALLPGALAGLGTPLQVRQEIGEKTTRGPETGLK